jgi:hypothetical protein
MSKYLILLILVSLNAIAYEPFNLECMKKEKKKCGKDDLSFLIKHPETKLTKHQQKVLECRVLALIKCRNKENDNKQ